MLTPRELDVLQLIARGCTYVQVAERLGMSSNTVGSHIKNAYRKLEVHTAAAAVMRAVELQLLGEASGRDNRLLGVTAAVGPARKADT